MKSKTIDDVKNKLLRNIKINTENDCWEWVKPRLKTIEKSYAYIFYNKKHKLAHRTSYEVFVGEIPPKMLVCHHCDNPPCINPKHLFLGTNKDNAQDMIRKGRQVSEKTKKEIVWKRVIRIKRCLNRKKTISYIACMMKMSEQEIMDIRDKKIYSDIGLSIDY